MEEVFVVGLITRSGGIWKKKNGIVLNEWVYEKYMLVFTDKIYVGTDKQCLTKQYKMAILIQNNTGQTSNI